MGISRVKKRKIAVIGSSRASYGYKRRIIQLLHKSPVVELQLIMTGAHLIPGHDAAIKDLAALKIPITARVEMFSDEDTPAAFAQSLGREIQQLSQVYAELKPELILITGDRGEMLAATLTAAYMNIPVVHIQAGDVSGHIDGTARHAITKLSHVHLCSCEDSAKRVARMGEEPWRIHNVGAPQLDEIINGKKLTKHELEKRYRINFDEPVLLLIQHPVLIDTESAYEQMLETLEAIEHCQIPTIIDLPNIDPGGTEIGKAIQSYAHLSFIHADKDIDRETFISLLSTVSAIVGNSSCGILEAPSFKLPAINIGIRQRGRFRASNVIDVDHDKKKIIEAIHIALYDEAFRSTLRSCRNPYGDGHSSERIVNLLKTLEITERLLDKQLTY